MTDTQAPEANGDRYRSGQTERTVHRACNLCEAICGLEFKVKDDRIVSIKGDEADPLSRGHICPKAIALKDLHEDQDRLRRPVKRTTSGGQEIDWDEAFDLTVSRLLDIRGQHGANSIGAYLGNPNAHNLGSMTHAQHFLGPLCAYFPIKSRYFNTDQFYEKGMYFSSGFKTGIYVF